jgi:hypothetical protein
MSDTVDAAFDAALTSATSGSAESGASSSAATSTGTLPADPAVAAGTAAHASKPDQSAATTVPPDADDETIDDATTFTLEKHKRILENARRKEAARVTREVTENIRKQYGLSHEEIDAYRPHIDFIRQHGWGAYHQRLSQQFQPPPAPPAKAERPAPDLRADDGTPAYSAPQLERLLAWQEAKFEEKFNSRLQPLQQTHESIQTERMWTQAQTNARQQYDEAKTWEGFDELRADIATLMRNDGRFSLEGAYSKLLREKYIPSLKAKTRQSTIDEIKTRPDGNTARPTAIPRTASNSKARSIDDQLDHALRAALSAT